LPVAKYDLAGSAKILIERQEEQKSTAAPDTCIPFLPRVFNIEQKLALQIGLH
jgi:hypothetical protein